MRNRQRRLLRRRLLRLLLRQRKRLQRLLRLLLQRLPPRRHLLLKLLLPSKQKVVLETNKSQKVLCFLAFFVVECFVFLGHFPIVVVSANVFCTLSLEFRNAFRVKHQLF